MASHELAQSKAFKVSGKTKLLDGFFVRVAQNRLVNCFAWVFCHVDWRRAEYNRQSSSCIYGWQERCWLFLNINTVLVSHYCSPFLNCAKMALNCALSALAGRSEEHTSELQSRFDLVCRLLLEK